MYAVLSIIGVVGMAVFFSLFLKRRQKAQPARLQLVLAIAFALTALIFMFLDPHKVLAVLLLISTLIAIGISLVLLIVNAARKKPLGKVGKVFLASFIILVLALSAMVSLSPEPGPGSDIVQGDDTPYSPEQGGQTDPGDEPGESSDPADEDNQPGDPDLQNPEPGDETPAGSVTVHYIDVGQGDSILIQTPDKAVLIDGGSRSAGAAVVSYLNKQGIKALDIVISTHPHEDHIGGLIDVLGNITVREVIDSGVAHTSKTFEDYIDLIAEKGIPYTQAEPGITRNLGGTVQLQVIQPKAPSASDLNNASVVVRLSFGATAFLFTGDAEAEAEEEMLNSSFTLASTVLKVGHHGSETSTSQAFLNRVNPGYAIISAGTDNSYEHPRQATLDKLKQANINTYRTDLHGTIVVSSDGEKVMVMPAQSAGAEAVFTGADFRAKDPGEVQKEDDDPPPQEEPPQEPAPKDPPAPEDPPADPPSAEKGQYIGSTESDKYHYPSCRFAEKILPENEIWFADVQAALDADYVSCGICKPPAQ